MFAVVGEALLDMVQGPGDTYLARPGGGPLNIAVGLRRLGHHTAMMTRLSSSPLGEILRRYAGDNELDLSAAVSAASPATLAFASLDSQGRASYDFYVDGTADWAWSTAELARLPRHAQVVHTGSLVATIEPARPVWCGPGGASCGRPVRCC
ncbi:MAG: PfkB family carbohydrate kinase [Nocardioidaceae bacterium]